MPLKTGRAWPAPAHTDLDRVRMATVCTCVVALAGCALLAKWGLERVPTPPVEAILARSLPTAFADRVPMLGSRGGLGYTVTSVTVLSRRNLRLTLDIASTARIDGRRFAGHVIATGTPGSPSTDVTLPSGSDGFEVQPSDPGPVADKAALGVATAVFDAIGEAAREATPSRAQGFDGPDTSPSSSNE